MVTASLIQLWRGHISISPSPSRSKKAKLASQESLCLNGQSLSDIEDRLKEANSLAEQMVDRNRDTMSKQLLAGWYAPTLSLVRLLVGDEARKSKNRVDHFINTCSHLSHLREVVFKLRVRAMDRRSELSSKYVLKRASTALSRYLLLIMFDAFVAHHVQLATKSNSNEEVFTVNFKDWLALRPGLLLLLSSLNENPSLALQAVSVEDPSAIGLPIYSGIEESDAKEQDAEALSMWNVMLKR